MQPDPRDARMPDEIRLRHMLDAAREARAFLEGKPFDQFFADRVLILAVTKSIEIIGEAARCISDETRSLLPSVPWPQIVGMRHRVVHLYFNINPRIVWDTVQTDLPPLIAALESYLAPGSGQPDTPPF